MDIRYLIKRIRSEVKHARDGRIDVRYVRTEDLIALCDEVERLERDLELAKQDWTA
jgi:hypothetical protein